MHRAFLTHLRYAISTVLSPAGVLTAALFSLIYTIAMITPFGGVRFLLVFMAAVLTYELAIIDHLGQWKTGLPNPSQFSSLPDLWDMLGRGVALFLLEIGPLILAFVYYSWGAVAEEGQGFGGFLEAHPFMLGLIILLPQVYLPAAFLLLVFSRQIVGAFWVPAWIQIAAMDPRAYGELVAQFFLTNLALVGAAVLTAGLFKIFLLGALIHGTILCLIVFVQGALMGIFLGNHHKSFGYFPQELQEL